MFIVVVYEASRRCASKSFGSKKEVFVFLFEKASTATAVTVFFV